MFLVKSCKTDERYALKRLLVNNEHDLAVCKREINIVVSFHHLLANVLTWLNCLHLPVAFYNCL